MKKPFQKLTQYLSDKNDKTGSEQQHREARIQQLESERNQKRFRILHPLKSRKLQKEIELLHKEITSSENRKRKHKRLKIILFSAAGAQMALFLLVGILANATSPHEGLYDPALASYNIEQFSLSYSAPTEASMASAFLSSESTENDANQARQDSAESSPMSESAETLPPANSVSEEAIRQEPMESTYCEITSDDLDISFLRDYTHNSNTSIYLGQNEGVTFTLSASDPSHSVTADDIQILYDDTLLVVEVDALPSNASTTSFHIYVTARTECTTKIMFGTTFELSALREQAPVHSFDIAQLDAVQGQLVYITPTGKRYHFSKSCAGENAIPTTLFDVSSYYTPCKKCAS